MDVLDKIFGGNLITAAIAAAPAVPGGAAAVAAIPAVYRDRYDFTTPVPRPANNVANSVLKDFELQTNNKATVYKAYLNLFARKNDQLSRRQR